MQRAQVTGLRQHPLHTWPEARHPLCRCGRMRRSRVTAPRACFSRLDTLSASRCNHWTAAASAGCQQAKYRAGRLHSVFEPQLFLALLLRALTQMLVPLRRLVNPNAVCIPDPPCLDVYPSCFFYPHVDSPSQAF
jgi:hypothetical protein